MRENENSDHGTAIVQDTYGWFYRLNEDGTASSGPEVHRVNRIPLPEHVGRHFDTDEFGEMVIISSERREYSDSVGTCRVEETAVAVPDWAYADETECEGHESLAGAGGESVYCDGTCRTPSFDEDDMIVFPLTETYPEDGS